MAARIIEVTWHPPIRDWIKRNYDEAFSSTLSGLGSIFRNFKWGFLLAFAEPLIQVSSLNAKFTVVLRVIELASDKGWNKLWIKSDCLLATQAFSNDNLIPWHLRTCWNTCKKLTLSMTFTISHVYRERNMCADFLANLSCTLPLLTIFDAIPLVVRNDYVKKLA